MVEVAQELNCFKIFAPTKFIGDPLSLLPRVVQIEHRRHGVDAQAVDMKTVAPEERVRGEKIPHFMPAIVEDKGTPILVGALTGIFMFVERGSIESRQRPIVAWKMGRNPINKDANASIMERVHEVLEIVR